MNRKKNNGVYARYRDDSIILTKTKRDFRKARKTLFSVLDTLKLKLSSSKTWMGKLTHGFHFLGVRFEVPRSLQRKSQVSIMIHSRSCARALTKVNALSSNAVHPAKIQRYLVRWAAWWSVTVRQLRVFECLAAWIIHSHEKESPYEWIGRGLLLGAPSHTRLVINIR